MEILGQSYTREKMKTRARRKFYQIYHQIFKIAALFLICCLLAPFVSGDARASGDSPESRKHAEQLAALGLLRGTGVLPDGSPDYNLNQTPSRLQGIILLIRLLGAEEQAMSLSPYSPFTDINRADDSARYVAYAWRAGITKGATASTFQPGAPLTARMFLTFLLRALGYSESEHDFIWGGQARPKRLRSSKRLISTAAILPIYATRP